MLLLVTTLSVTSDPPETLTPGEGLPPSSCVIAEEGGWGGVQRSDEALSSQEPTFLMGLTC